MEFSPMDLATHLKLSLTRGDVALQEHLIIICRDVMEKQLGNLSNEALYFLARVCAQRNDKLTLAKIRSKLPEDGTARLANYTLRDCAQFYLTFAYVYRHHDQFEDARRSFQNALDLACRFRDIDYQTEAQQGLMTLDAPVAHNQNGKRY